MFLKNNIGRAFNYFLFALLVFAITGFVGIGVYSNADTGRGQAEKLAHTLRSSSNVNDAGETWFVGIGISEYENPNWPDLRNARTDMLDIFLTLKTGYGFDLSHSILLTDSVATRKTILDSLKGLCSRLDEKDNIVIYYSGHGYYDDASRGGYWVPYDASVSTLSSLISYRELIDNVVKPSKTLHLVLIMDACYAGSVFSLDQMSVLSARGVKADSVEEETYYQKIGAIRSREAFTSGRQEQVSDGGGKHSPFAQAILDFCNSERGIFTVSEMAGEVEKRVSMKTKQLPRYGQLNNVGDEGGKFVFRKR